MQSFLKISIFLGFLFTSQFCFALIRANEPKSSWSVPQKEHPPSQEAHEQNPVKTETTPYSPESHNFALDLGQVFLIGDLGKYSDNLGAQFHYTYGVSDLFGFDSSIGYSEHSDGKLSLFSIISGIRINMSWYDKIIPYAILGLGFYRPNYKDVINTTGQTQNLTNEDSAPSAFLFGLHMGPGIDLALSPNIFFGASLIIHTMFGSTKILSNGQKLDMGGTCTSFLLHIGTSF